MLELATKAFYTHDTLQGFILVAVVCGAMTMFSLWVAWRNFGPPSKRSRDAAQRR